jgi:hypothetical protein
VKGNRKPEFGKIFICFRAIVHGLPLRDARLLVLFYRAYVTDDSKVYLYKHQYSRRSIAVNRTTFGQKRPKKWTVFPAR